MSRDASIEDFAGDEDPDTGAREPAGETESQASTAVSAGGRRDADGSPHTADAEGQIEDALSGRESTYAVRPDDRPCQRCGTPTARRWREEGRLVCETCKSW